MAFDYQRDTRDHYQNAEIASTYHTAFAGARRWRTFRARTVADRERAAVSRFLERIPHGRVLDLPAGTGKLAPVFANLGASVVACDISSSMLDIARREYAAAACDDVTFRVCDAEQINVTLGQRFDAAVCLRLLHRVPPDVRRRILAELAKCADYVIVSMGIESTYHRWRRHARNGVFGGGTNALCYEGLTSFRGELSADFDILGQSWILPMLSQEMVFLLRPSV